MELLQLSKKKLRLAVGLLTGHSMLNAHLQLRLVPDSACKLCAKEEETTYVLCDCESLRELRKKYLGEERLEYDEIQTAPIKMILDFVESTDLIRE